MLTISSRLAPPPSCAPLSALIYLRLHRLRPFGSPASPLTLTELSLPSVTASPVAKHLPTAWEREPRIQGKRQRCPPTPSPVLGPPSISRRHARVLHTIRGRLLLPRPPVLVASINFVLVLETLFFHTSSTFCSVWYQGCPDILYILYYSRGSLAAARYPSDPRNSLLVFGRVTTRGCSRHLRHPSRPPADHPKH